MTPALPVGVGGLGLRHGRGGDPHHVEGPDQVDRDDPLVAGQVVRGTVHVRRSADAQPIPAQLTPAAQRLPRGHREVPPRPAPRASSRHVGAGEQAADLVRDLLAAVLVQVGDDHRGPRRGEQPARVASPRPLAPPEMTAESTVELHAGSIPAAVFLAHRGPGVCGGNG